MKYVYLHWPLFAAFAALTSYAIYMHLYLEAAWIAVGWVLCHMLLQATSRLSPRDN